MCLLSHNVIVPSDSGECETHRLRNTEQGCTFRTGIFVSSDDIRWIKSGYVYKARLHVTTTAMIRVNTSERQMILKNIPLPLKR